MIITSGKFRGFKLKTPKGLSTRPTSSMIKQAVFNICRNTLPGSYFLDLFAGSGAIGLEALSEGAEFALFIENNKLALSCILANISSLDLKSKTRVLRDISNLQKTNLKFDLVYIDPPYKYYDEKGFVSKILISLMGNLQNDARIFLEAPSSKDMEIDDIKNFKLESVRKYGSSSLVIFSFCST